MGFLAVIGRSINEKVTAGLYAAGFLFQILKESLFFFQKKQVGYKVLIMQILFTGFEALTTTAFISLALGAVIIIEGISLLPQFGQGSLIYTILITVITRELGPILTAFILTARSCTAITTELGNMVISHEIEAYVSVGINPISYLAVPRFLGVTISIMILNVYFNIFGLAGSFFISQFIKTIPPAEYFSNILQALRLVDILSSFLKSFVFGVIISTVATYHGFKVGNSITEIPQVVIKAVGKGFVFCIVADAIITLMYYV